MYWCMFTLLVWLFAHDSVEIESIPEESPEEPGDPEAAAADAYVSEGKSHRSFTLTMIDPKWG